MARSCAKASWRRSRISSLRVGSLRPEGVLQGADGIGGGIERIILHDEPTFLGTEKKDKEHHHGDGAFVELVVGDPFKQGPPGIAVDPVEGLYQDLDGLSHLKTQLIGDFLLVFLTPCKDLFRCLVFSPGEERATTQE